MNSRTIVFFLSIAVSGLAQERFDVASIKPSAADAHGMSIQFQPPLGIRVSNVPLRMLITFAYDVREFQVSGGPGWIGSDRFDILAKSERKAGGENIPDDPKLMTEAQLNTRAEEMRERVRNLLAERFGLKIHRESKEGAVYGLMVAKSGAKIESVKEDRMKRLGISAGRGQMTAFQLSMAMFAGFLSGQLNRPVLDQTGLTGKYDFKLVWTPDMSEGREPGESPPPTAAPDGPSLFTALREQLGLRLEAQRGPVPMIVIDQVEQPSAN